VPGDTLKGADEVNIVSVREKIVGALLGEGLLPMLKLGVGDKDGEPLGLGVGVAEADCEGEKELDPVIDGVGVNDEVGEGVPDGVGVGV